MPGLAFIGKLRPVTYTVDIDGIDDYYTGSKELVDNAAAEGIKIKHRNPAAATNVQSGFLAQDVADAARELGYDFCGVDVPANDKALYGLRYADFVVPMVKAIQEQQVLIEALKKRIALLENK